MNKPIPENIAMTLDYMLLRTLMITLEFLSVGLALFLVYLFFKVYHSQRSIYLLGMPFGFFFLLISSLFLGIHIIYTTFQPVTAFSSSLMWIRVVTQPLGFSLIALSYITAGKYQNTNRNSYMIILAGTTASILSAFGILSLLSPVDLELVYSYNNFFAIISITLLSYIIIFLLRKIQLAKTGYRALINAPLAFIFLWIGQFSFLAWSLIEGGTVAQVGSQIARVVGLALFVQIFYAISKESKTNVCEEKEQN
jgi:hypothetical protein